MTWKEGGKVTEAGSCAQKDSKDFHCQRPGTKWQWPTTASQKGAIAKAYRRKKEKKKRGNAKLHLENNIQEIEAGKKKIIICHFLN